MRGYMWLRPKDAFVGIDDRAATWPWKVECPVCGERLEILKDDVIALAFGQGDDGRGWSAVCPECNTALDALAGHTVHQDMTPRLVPHYQ